jgi:ubiquinone/menaquinone biosynthesis C-methylase UbiE
MTIKQNKLMQDYNLIWDSYLKNENLTKIQNIRLINRQPYYETIQKYICHFNYPTVLELGCGTGIDINAVYNENRNIFPCASDILITSMEVGRKVGHLFKNQIKFFVSDTLDVPLKDNKVDIVFSQGLVEHFRNPLAVVKEQTRILKKGGFLIINVPQKFTGYTVIKKAEMRKGQWELGWETAFSYQDLRIIGHKLNLKQVAVLGYQYWKSWREPAFVLKDLIDKIFRRVPVSSYKLCAQIQKSYNTLWKKLERKWGHYFLQNIIIVFRK